MNKFNPLAFPAFRADTVIPVQVRPFHDFIFHIIQFYMVSNKLVLRIWTENDFQLLPSQISLTFCQIDWATIVFVLVCKKKWLILISCGILSELEWIRRLISFRCIFPVITFWEFQCNTLIHQIFCLQTKENRHKHEIQKFCLQLNYKSKWELEIDQALTIKWMNWTWLMFVCESGTWCRDFRQSGDWLLYYLLWIQQVQPVRSKDEQAMSLIFREK